MIVHEIFAQICDGEVKNIMVCDNYPTADYLTKCVYGDEAYAVDCLQYACCIGDKYHDGAFYRVGEDGTETAIPYKPTQKQQVTDLENQLTEAQMALTEQYEANLSLEEEVTNTQMALVEIYESKEM